MDITEMAKELTKLANQLKNDVSSLIFDRDQHRSIANRSLPPEPPPRHPRRIPVLEKEKFSDQQRSVKTDRPIESIRSQPIAHGHRFAEIQETPENTGNYEFVKSPVPARKSIESPPKTRFTSNSPMGKVSENAPILTKLDHIDQRIDKVEDDLGVLLVQVRGNRKAIQDQSELAELVKANTGAVHEHGETIKSIKSGVDRLETGLNTVTQVLEKLAGARSKGESPREALLNLTQREKQILGILSNYGFLGYKEIGNYLGVSPITAKGLVNRMLGDTGKSSLLIKTTDSRGVKVGVDEETKEKLLNKRAISEE